MSEAKEKHIPTTHSNATSHRVVHRTMTAMIKITLMMVTLGCKSLIEFSNSAGATCYGLDTRRTDTPKMGKNVNRERPLSSSSSLHLVWFANQPSTRIACPSTIS